MTTKTDNDMNERKARLAYADEANWFTLPGRAGVYDPVVGFEWAPYTVIVYGTPTRSRGGAGPSDLTVTAPTGTSAPIGRSRPPRPSRTLGGSSSASSGASGRPALPPRTRPPIAPLFRRVGPGWRCNWVQPKTIQHPSDMRPRVRASPATCRRSINRRPSAFRIGPSGASGGGRACR